MLPKESDFLCSTPIRNALLICMIVFSSSRREEQLGPEGAAGAHPHPQDVQDAVVVLDGAHHGRHEHRQRHGRALQPAELAHQCPL